MFVSGSRCSCGCSPCKCHTECMVPEPCYPPTVACPPPTPTITVEELLGLIEAKCDKEVCECVQGEVDAILAALGIADDISCGVDPLPDLAFQLVSNMVDSLSGDLTDKYPSAELLKLQLQALWSCMQDKQQHHGDWVDNFTLRNIEQSDDLCALDGDPALETIKVITPVDVGSTVYHTVEGRNCLFMSLVDNNLVPPSKMSVLDGLWLSYCDVKDVIDCVLPRRKLVDCTEACDDPNGDGIIEDKTLCERVEDLEGCAVCEVVDTGSVNLTKTAISGGTGGSIKADVVISPDLGNIAAINSGGLYVSSDNGLPAGAVTFIDTISGTFDIVVDGTPTSTSSGGIEFYEFLPSEKTFTVANYPYLGVAGQKLVLSMNASIGYFTTFADSTTLRAVNPYQWGTILYVDGTSRFNSVGDGYALNKSGHNSGLSDTGSVTILTTGQDIVVKFVYALIAEPADASYTIGDSLNVDMGSATLAFSASKY